MEDTSINFDLAVKRLRTQKKWASQSVTDEQITGSFEPDKKVSPI